jgi:hypothetical protein
MLRTLAIILFVIAFPAAALTIALALFVNPIFFLLLILLVLALPVIRAMLRRPAVQHH